MRVFRETLEIRTNGPMKYYDLTPILEEIVGGYRVVEGLIHVHAEGATPGLVVLDGEHLNVFNEALIKAIPAVDWRHGNAYAHLRSSVLGTHLVLAVHNGGLWLGEDYRVYYVETRPVHSHRRRIHIFIESWK